MPRLSERKRAASEREREEGEGEGEGEEDGEAGRGGRGGQENDGRMETRNWESTAQGAEQSRQAAAHKALSTLALLLLWSEG